MLSYVLQVSFESWEAGVVDLDSKLFRPIGLDVHSFSRAPYLGRGDANQRVYEYDAAVFVLGRHT